MLQAAQCFGLEDEAVRGVCAEAAGDEICEAVNYNAPLQVVIAGHAGAVKRAMETAKARGAKRAVALPVSAPFHSSLMAPAAARLRLFVDQLHASASTRRSTSATVRRSVTATSSASSRPG